MTAEEESKQVMAEELSLKHTEREALKADLQKIGRTTEEALRRLDMAQGDEAHAILWRIVRWPWTKH